MAPRTGSASMAWVRSGRRRIVVAINDQTGEEIGLTEDYAVGVGIGDDLLAIGDGGADSVGNERGQIGHLASFLASMRMAICDEVL